MKKIIINLHHCSPGEYQKLISYLVENSWDYKELENDPAEKIEPIDPVRADIEKLVNNLAQAAEKNGACRLDVCDHPNWNKFQWNHRNSIIAGLRAKSYEVNTITKHGVLEIHISKFYQPLKQS